MQGLLEAATRAGYANIAAVSSIEEWVQCVEAASEAAGLLPFLDKSTYLNSTKVQTLTQQRIDRHPARDSADALRDMSTAKPRFQQHQCGGVARQNALALVCGASRQRLSAARVPRHQRSALVEILDEARKHLEGAAIASRFCRPRRTT